MTQPAGLPNLVGKSAPTATAVNTVITVNSQTRLGSTLLLCHKGAGGAVLPAGPPVDSAGRTWDLLYRPVTAGQILSVYAVTQSAEALGVGDQITALAAGATNQVMVVEAWVGPVNAQMSNGNQNSNGVGAVTGAATPATTVAPTLAMFFMSQNTPSGTGIAVTTAGWTLFDPNNIGDMIAVAWQDVPGLQAVGPVGWNTGTGTAISVIAYTLVFEPAPQPLEIVTTELAPATIGQPYTTELVAAGGTPPYSWSATGLPAGLALDPGGTISGTPT